MKVFNVENRKNLIEDNQTIMDLMNKEYEFYQSICNDYTIGEKDYKVCKRVNFQCRTTLVCNAKCPFCIEKDSCRKNEISNEQYLAKLDQSLKELHGLGVQPSVTITGGEPCLWKDKLLAILSTLKANNVSKLNLNTNGILLNEKILNAIKESEMPHLNISIHHYDLEKNRTFFGGVSISLEQLKYIKEFLGGTYYDTTRVRLQCVLMKGGIDSLEEVKKFLDFAKELGFDNVAFRGLSKLKEVGVNKELHDYCDEKAIDMFPILNELAKDNEFKFNCQNISDHYMYEDWVYNGIDVHFAYSDMDILEKYEKEETAQGINYAREFVLYEDGSFCGGWNKEIKMIY